MSFWKRPGVVRIGRGAMALLVLVTLLASVAGAYARGGRTDECPPDSKDPDCIATPASPPPPPPPSPHG